MYIHCSFEPVIKKAASEFPAVVLTGPLRSGKITLLLHLFNHQHRYVSVELPDIRVVATEDPCGFLEQYSQPVIIDEVQYVQDLLSYIKGKIDQDQSRTGQFLLTGSQGLFFAEKVTESMAGRAAILQLSPLTQV